MNTSLLDALEAIQGTGQFHSHGDVPSFFPELIVEGVGEIALPLSLEQANAIIGVSEAAPFGERDRTVFDESVRKCWQLDSAQFHFDSPDWAAFLNQTLDQIARDLGIQGKISAHPYKLLLYGEGGHFKPHRDSEKLDAMFGTLIIALPSTHEGGRLLIRHDGREAEVDFSAPASRRRIQWVALFADCEHEVQPVQSGFRFCLTYNLKRKKGKAQALNQPISDQARTLIPALHDLKLSEEGRFVAVLMEHSYTEANFSLQMLKGNDQARARALFLAAREAGMIAHLALVTLYQMGELESRYYRRGYNLTPLPGDSMGEIYEERLSLHRWLDESGKSASLGDFAIKSADLLTRKPIGTGKPDEAEAEGFTGNAGCTMEYWYHRAAIVLWNPDDEIQILCQYDFNGACKMLLKLAKKSDSPRFQALAKVVAGNMAKETEHFCRGWYRKFDEENSFIVALNALMKAKKNGREALEIMVHTVSSLVWTRCSLAHWKHLYSTFGVEPFTPVHQTLLIGDDRDVRKGLFTILAALGALGEALELQRTIALRVCSFSPAANLISREPCGDQFDSSAHEEVEEYSFEVRALLSVDSALKSPDEREAVIDFILADRSLTQIRRVLAPALLKTNEIQYSMTEGSMAEELYDFACMRLMEEIEIPVEPYPDMVRPCPMIDEFASPDTWKRMDSTKQNALKELVDFMADPSEKSFDFRYLKELREDLEGTFKHYHLDLNYETIRSGRPQALRCTKNDNGYFLRMKLREKDQILLMKLENL